MLPLTVVLNCSLPNIGIIAKILMWQIRKIEDLISR